MYLYACPPSYKVAQKPRENRYSQTGMEKMEKPVANYGMNTGVAK
jgi:hypothetical protein